MARGWLLALAVVAACGGGADGVELTSATPPYGPVTGGTRILLHGSGFVPLGAGSNRVMFGDHEAPLVATLDDGTLDVVVPAGDRPGAVEVMVLSGDHTARGAGLFRYTTAPTVTAVSPRDVLYSSTAARLTVTGTGFVAEGAGDVAVFVDGHLATDVLVTSDTTLRFTAPAGLPLAQPDVEVVNRRGRGVLRRGFRYVPSFRRGLILFTRFAPGLFAVYFDPSSGATVPIPSVSGGSVYRAVVLDERGAYWAMEGGAWGRLDMTTQRMEGGVGVGAWLPTMIRVGSQYFALDRSRRRFGTFDPSTLLFTPIGDAPVTCCGSFGLASNGTFYFTARDQLGVAITSIDPVTGVVGTPLHLTAAAGFRVEEMRFFDGVLYAVSRDSTVATIDLDTGLVTVVATGLGRFTAMELFEPASSP